MSKRDAPFRSELEELIFDPKHRFVDDARSSSPIREHLLRFLGIRLLGIGLQGKLPGNLILEKSRAITVKTESETFVNIVLSLSNIQISFQPGLHLDVTVLGEASLTEIKLVFGEAAPRITMRDIGISVDPRRLILDELGKRYGEIIRKSAFAQPGYDWTRDPRLLDNLNQFYESIVNPFEPRGPFVANLLLESLSVNAIALSEQEKSVEAGSVRVFPGSPIDLTVDFQASLSTLVDAKKQNNPQAAVDEITLNGFKIDCPIHVLLDGQEIARINKLEISQDCQVFIRDFVIVQKAATIENTVNSTTVTLASFWNLLIEVLRVANVAQTAQTVSEPVRNEAIAGVLGESLVNISGAAKAKPNIVANTLIKELEPKFTEKVRQLVRENLHSFPGIDLTKLFELCKDLR